MKPIAKSERYTLSKLVVESLKQYILEQKLQPGERLPSERDLCQMMNISRTILREALHSLESIGILEIRHGEGSFVASQFLAPVAENLNFALQTKAVNVTEMVQIRYMLEAAALAEMTYADGEQLNELEHHFLIFANSAPDKEMNEQSDAAFHLHIIQSLRNDSYMQLCKPFIINLPHGINKQTNPEQHRLEHERYVETIVQGDIPLATSLLKAHLGLDHGV